MGEKIVEIPCDPGTEDYGRGFERALRQLEEARKLTGPLKPALPPSQKLKDFVGGGCSCFNIDWGNATVVGYVCPNPNCPSRIRCSW